MDRSLTLRDFFYRSFRLRLDMVVRRLEVHDCAVIFVGAGHTQHPIRLAEYPTKIFEARHCFESKVDSSSVVMFGWRCLTVYFWAVDQVEFCAHVSGAHWNFVLTAQREERGGGPFDWLMQA